MPTLIKTRIEAEEMVLDIIDALHSTGLSYDQIARRIDTHRDNIFKWRRRESLPRIETVLEMQALLERRLAELKKRRKV